MIVIISGPPALTCSCQLDTSGMARVYCVLAWTGPSYGLFVFFLFGEYEDFFNVTHPDDG